MANKPYRPLYIGDHDRECKSLSLEAEGALVRIKNTLWDSKTPGLLSFCFSNLCVLLKNPPEKVHKIISELNDFTTVFIKILPENRVEICCQEMIEKAELSAIRAESGSKGGRPKKQSESKTKPKEKLKRSKTVKYEIDIETEDENKIELGGVGEKPKTLHVQMREVFLDEYKRSTGITYSYNGIDGKKINELEKQIRVTIRDKIDGYTDEDVLNTFKILMQNIPQWYRQNCFDLKGIAGNYQKIMAQLNIKYNGANLTDIDRQVAERIKRDPTPYS